MGRIGINYDDVANAAHQLQGKGKTTTVDNVRAVLGTGSKSTIARHLKDWKNQKGIENASEGAVPSELLSLVKGLWERLQSSVEKQANEYRCEADNKVTNANQALQQKHKENTTLQEQIHNTEEQLHQKGEENKTLQNNLITEQKDKAKINERLTALTHHCEEQQKETERLHDLLNHVQKNLEHYQTETQTLREKQALLLDKQRNEYELKIAGLQKQLSEGNAEKSQYKAQHEQLNKEHQQIQKEQKEKIKELKSLQEKHQQLSAENQALQQQHNQLDEKYKQQTKELNTKEKTLIEVQIKLGAADENTASLKKAISKAEDKIEALRQNYDFVSHEKANIEGQLKQLQIITSRTRAQTA